MSRLTNHKPKVVEAFNQGSDRILDLNPRLEIVKRRRSRIVYRSPQQTLSDMGNTLRLAAKKTVIEP